jgi:hypothetical protein
MAIQLEFINFIVPIDIIKEKYPNGWVGCLKDHQHLIGGRVWYDNYLFRDGAMNPYDIESLVNYWKALGFQPYEGQDKPQKWIDCCVVEALFGGPTLPCAWITVEEEFAYMKGKPKGEIKFRDNVK